MPDNKHCKENAYYRCHYSMFLSHSKAEGFASQSKREEQDLSSSLLLDLAKQAEPIGEAVCAKSGWWHRGIAGI